MAGQSPLMEVKGGEKVDVIAPEKLDQAFLMGSNFQAAQASSTTPAQGKDEEKSEKWKEFFSKTPQPKPENRINEQCLEKQLVDDNKLCPDKGGVGRDIARLTDRTLVDLSEVEINTKKILQLPQEGLAAMRISSMISL